jgi:hypothetical protein
MGFAAKQIAVIAVIVAVALLQTTDEYPALSSIPFDQSGEYVVHFRERHNRDVTLLLEVAESKGESDRPELTHLQTIIEVTLVDQTGRTICHAVGSPKDGISKNNWVLRTGRGDAAFWHNNCAEVKLRHSKAYTLTVRIRDADPKTPKIRLTPIFERSDDFGP